MWLSVSVWPKATPQLDVGIASGIEGPIHKFGDNYTVPVGVLGQVSINKQLAVGTWWGFGKVTGASALKTGSDFRSWHLWVTYKM